MHGVDMRRKGKEGTTALCRHAPSATTTPAASSVFFRLDGISPCSCMWGRKGVRAGFCCWLCASAILNLPGSTNTPSLPSPSCSLSSPTTTTSVLCCVFASCSSTLYLSPWAVRIPFRITMDAAVSPAGCGWHEGDMRHRL